MEDPEEHALVLKALLCGLSNCIHWKRNLRERIVGDPDLRGLSPLEIKRLFLERLRAGFLLIQDKETDVEYKHENPLIYYHVVPHVMVPRGIYVKCVPFDFEDPEYPEVILVSVHQATWEPRQ